MLNGQDWKRGNETAFYTSAIINFRPTTPDAARLRPFSPSLWKAALQSVTISSFPGCRCTKLPAAVPKAENVHPQGPRIARSPIGAMIIVCKKWLAPISGVSKPGSSVRKGVLCEAQFRYCYGSRSYIGLHCKQRHYRSQCSSVARSAQCVRSS